MTDINKDISNVNDYLYNSKEEIKEEKEEIKEEREEIIEEREEIKEERKEIINNESEIEFTNNPNEEDYKKSSKYTKSLISNFLFLLCVCILYSIFYTVCLFDNPSGMTFPLYIAGTIIVNIIILRKLEIQIKKKTYIHLIGAFLLGISSFMTTNTFIYIFNFIGCFLLIIIFMIKQFYDDEKWDFINYFSNIFKILFGAIGSIAAPYYHYLEYKKSKIKSQDSVNDNNNNNNNNNLKNIMIGILISIPMVLVILILLMSADSIFGTLIDNLVSQIFITDRIFTRILMLAVGFLALYCGISSLAKDNLQTKSYTIPKKTPVIAITFTTILSIIYFVFCIIQILYLFLGLENNVNPVNISEYARKGFFELLFVSIINFTIIIFSLENFENNKILNHILIFISICTYILIFSSAYRMILYVGKYDLTFLRILVLWFLIVLTILITGIIIYITNKDFKFFKFCLSVIAVSYLIFSFSRPDWIIAAYNIQYADQLQTADYEYLLNELSDDAIPQLAKVNISELNIEDPEEYRYITDSIHTHFKKVYDKYNDQPFYKLNLSKIQARNAAKQYLEDNER